MRYFWHAGRVWHDSGLRDYLGRFLLYSLTKKGEGVTVHNPIPVEGRQLEACQRIWG